MHAISNHMGCQSLWGQTYYSINCIKCSRNKNNFVHFLFILYKVFSITNILLVFSQVKNVSNNITGQPGPTQRWGHSGTAECAARGIAGYSFKLPISHRSQPQVVQSQHLGCSEHNLNWSLACLI